MIIFDVIEDVELWLNTRSENEIAIFVSRVSLRSIPTIIHLKEKISEEILESKLLLPTFWAVSTSFVAATFGLRNGNSDKPGFSIPFSTSVLKSSARAADDANYYLENYIEHAHSGSGVTPFALAATSAARAAYALETMASLPKDVYTKTDTISDAIYATQYAMEACDCKAFLQACAIDAELINNAREGIEFSNTPLWPEIGQGGLLPTNLGASWKELRQAFELSSLDWAVWFDWYENRLKGVKVSDTQNELARISFPIEEYQDPSLLNSKLANHFE